MKVKSVRMSGYVKVKVGLWLFSNIALRVCCVYLSKSYPREIVLPWLQFIVKLNAGEVVYCNCLSFEYEHKDQYSVLIPESSRDKGTGDASVVGLLQGWPFGI